MTIKYRGYTIKQKMDFTGFLYFHRGFNLREGFVVTDGGIINVMPGAAWFRTPEDAAFAIDDLIIAKGSSEKFWLLNEKRRRRNGMPKAWQDNFKETKRDIKKEIQ